MHSIIGSWLALFVSALESYGINGKEYLNSRNIHFPQSTNPNRRIELSTMHQLWREAEEMTKDPIIGLRAGTFVTSNTFGTLSLAVSSCCTVEKMTDLLSNYLQIFNTGCTMQLKEKGKCSIMYFTMPYDLNGELLVSKHGIDAAISAIYTLINSYNVKGLTPKKITLPYPKPVNTGQYQRFFNCPIEFGSESLLLCYESEFITKPIPGCSESIAKSTEELVMSALEQIQNDGITHKVRHIIIGLLEDGEASINNVALALNISSRTLHRRLEEESTSFRVLVDSVRQKTAMEHMKNSRLTVENIGYLLGFSSHSNYSRAFKRWTGLTPKEFRSS